MIRVATSQEGISLGGRFSLRIKSYLKTKQSGAAKRGGEVVRKTVFLRDDTDASRQSSFANYGQS